VPETSVERLRRRAAEVRAEAAGKQIAGVADEIRGELAEHAARLAAISQLMEDTVEAAGLTPPEPGRPRLRLIKGEAS
jgi:hypothetical protein